MEKKRSTDNNSGIADSLMVLPQTERNQEIARKVDVMLASGAAKTRRGARKVIQRQEGRR